MLRRKRSHTPPEGQKPEHRKKIKPDSPNGTAEDTVHGGTSSEAISTHDPGSQGNVAESRAPQHSFTQNRVSQDDLAPNNASQKISAQSARTEAAAPQKIDVPDRDSPSTTVQGPPASLVAVGGTDTEGTMPQGVAIQGMSSWGFPPQDTSIASASAPDPRFQKAPQALVPRPPSPQGTPSPDQPEGDTAPQKVSRKGKERAGRRRQVKKAPRNMAWTSSGPSNGRSQHTLSTAQPSKGDDNFRRPPTGQQPGLNNGSIQQAPTQNYPNSTADVFRPAQPGPGNGNGNGNGNIQLMPTSAGPSGIHSIDQQQKFGQMPGPSNGNMQTTPTSVPPNNIHSMYQLPPVGGQPGPGGGQIQHVPAPNQPSEIRYIYQCPPSEVPPGSNSGIMPHFPPGLTNTNIQHAPPLNYLSSIHYIYQGLPIRSQPAPSNGNIQYQYPSVLTRPSMGQQHPLVSQQGSSNVLGQQVPAANQLSNLQQCPPTGPQLGPSNSMTAQYPLQPSNGYSQHMPTTTQPSSSSNNQRAPPIEQQPGRNSTTHDWPESHPQHWVPISVPPESFSLIQTLIQWLADGQYRRSQEIEMDLFLMAWDIVRLFGSQMAEKVEESRDMRIMRGRVIDEARQRQYFAEKEHTLLSQLATQGRTEYENSRGRGQMVADAAHTEWARIDERAREAKATAESLAAGVNLLEHNDVLAWARATGSGDVGRAREAQIAEETAQENAQQAGPQAQPPSEPSEPPDEAYQSDPENVTHDLRYGSEDDSIYEYWYNAGYDEDEVADIRLRREAREAEKRERLKRLVEQQFQTALNQANNQPGPAQQGN